MHGFVDENHFLQSVSGFLGGYYLVIAVMNAVLAYYLWRSGRAKKLFSLFGFPFTTVQLWLVVAVFFTIISPIAMSGNPELMKAVVSFPEGLRGLVNDLMNSVVYMVGIVTFLSVMFVGRRFFVKPTVAWAMLNFALLFMGYAMTNQDFAAIVMKSYNVPIVGMIYLLGFFTWLGAYQAVRNDERRKRGEPPLEKLGDEKVLVWPDLVYTELICMVALTALLLVWAIALTAPLEEPASAVKTPNPSKAPWYFLGLQEMLVYYDPWFAGVVAPSFIVFGLMAIPYLDFNKEGNGYYTIDERKFAYVTFQFGFIVLWVTLIVLGTFLRGPNWNFFGPFETWDPHKVEALKNVDLSDYYYFWLLDQPKPEAAPDAGVITQLWVIFKREFIGIFLVLGYFLALPPALVIFSKFFRKMFIKMGFMRYMVMTFLLLSMGLFPIKMVARWTVNLKYFISIPEWLLNF